MLYMQECRRIISTAVQPGNGVSVMDTLWFDYKTCNVLLVALKEQFRDILKIMHVGKDDEDAEAGDQVR